MKTFIRTLIILLAAGLVAGGVYLLVERVGLGLPGTGRLAEGTLEGGHGRGLGRGLGRGKAAEEQDATRERNEDGQGDLLRGEHEGETGLSFPLSGLGGVLAQAGKVALITLVVVAAQAAWRWFRRRRKGAPGPEKPEVDGKQ